MTRSERERIALELDRLRELANVGAGRAADALAQLLGQPVRMEVPRLRVRARAGACDPSASLGHGAAGVFFELHGGVRGVLAVLFPASGREALLRALCGGADDADVESALREAGNVLASHALSAMADLLGARALPSLPVLALEAASAVLASLHGRGDSLRVESRLVDAAGDPRGVLVWLPAARAEATGLLV